MSVTYDSAGTAITHQGVCLEIGSRFGRMKPERTIPDTVLRGAAGLAIITVIKVGIMLTYKLGTGLVVARRPDGMWSAPSAIGTCGVGWGPQVRKFVVKFSPQFGLLCPNGATYVTWRGCTQLGATGSVA